MKWFNFSYYRNKELKELIIYWLWDVPHIPFENVEYAKTPNIHQLSFAGTDNIYWVFYKDYGTKTKKYHFFKKTRNDHTACAG